MKKRISIAIALFILVHQAYTQICTSPRFTEVLVYPTSDIFIDSNVVYGSAQNWLGANETLSLNLAFPRLSVDTMAKRPLVFLIHGGGFVGGDKNDLNTEALLFARRGFVAVTIDYRLGRDCTVDSLSYDKAVYRAVQDANAAMRFIVNKADSMRIDTNWIFIGGGSAGAGTCLALVYTKQAEFNAIRPAIQPILGNLTTSTNSLTNTFSIKGIFNNWGAVGKDFFDEDEALPTISFHGDADPTVNVDSGFGASCTNPFYTYGSNLIHQKLTEWGICSQTVIKIGGDHGIYNNSFASINFRIGKASCFFKSVMCNVCYSDYTTDSIPATCSTTLSIDEFDNDAYTVYPNPVANIIHVTNINSNSDFSISILNMQGQLLTTVEHKDEISVQHLPDGLYILRVHDGMKAYSYKFVKGNQ